MGILEGYQVRSMLGGLGGGRRRRRLRVKEAMQVLEEYEKRMQGIDFYNALEAVLRLSSYLN